ncbi:MAG TPA: DUF6094 domain-containing protein [Ktedonobacterales bacterium]|nr:DUF6094 domain-containing protein [Ktedonobacterales bacterium]
MSRINAVADMLYYPTPEPVTAALASYFVLPERGAGTIRLLDPCAGTGRALAQFAQLVEQQAGPTHPALELYGIEPNAERAALAMQALGVQRVLPASYFATQIQQQIFQGAWFNPPYDDASEEGQKGERLEITFLRRLTLHLAPGSPAIIIVPQRVLIKAARHLATYYDGDTLQCWRFPDEEWAPPDRDRKPSPMYEQFKQIVLFAVRRATPVPPDNAVLTRISGWGEAGAALPVLPKASDPTPRATYQFPVARTPLKLFASTEFAPEALAHQLNEPGIGVWGDPTYEASHFPDPAAVVGLGIGRPQMPLRRGHLAILTAAGIANGAVVQNTEGQRLLVKGACRKEVLKTVEVQKDASGENIEVVTLTDTFKMAVWGFDLDTGKLFTIQ